MSTAHNLLRKRLTIDQLKHIRKLELNELLIKIENSLNHTTFELLQSFQLHKFKK